jgi:MFS family permease
VVAKGPLDKLYENFLLLIDIRRLLIILVSIVTFLTWFLSFPLFGPIMKQHLGETMILKIDKGRVFEIFLFCISLSSIISGYFIEKTTKRVFYIYISGVGVSIVTFCFIIIDVSFIFPLIALLGLLSGISPPSWGSYFSDYTEPQERGRIMGVAIAISILISSLFILSSLNLKYNLIIISIISLLSLSSIINPEEGDDYKHRSKRGIGSKQIILNTIPIILFYVVVGILLSVILPTLQNKISPQAFYLSWTLPFIFGSIISGILFDTHGRKFPTIIGLAIMGISLGALGSLKMELSYLLIILLAVGFSFFMVYSFILWGDISPIGSIGTYYGIGFGLIWCAILIGLIFSGSIFGVISEEKLKSLLFFSAITIFLCIPPLIFAKETLPEDIITKKRIERHLKRVLRAREEEDSRNVDI